MEIRRVRRFAVALLLVVLIAAGVPLKAEILLIRGYQLLLSPIVSISTQCRYQPTCSEYGLRALESEGFVQGNLKLARRLVSCSPLGNL